jgi:hypothetical protein
MKSQQLTSKLDRIGMTASTLCAIHCAAVPLLITFLPLAGLGFLANPWVEWSMILLALIIGVSSISMSYMRTHHRILPIVLLVTGFVLIGLAHLFLTGWMEAFIVPAGGFTIAAAHFINQRYTGACQTDGHLHIIHHHYEKN